MKTTALRSKKFLICFSFSLFLSTGAALYSAFPAAAEQPFKLLPQERKVFEFEITSPGNLSAEARWQGSASSLALILNGPGRAQYYARKDGSSPLRLSFSVSSSYLASGTNWKLTVVNFNRSGEAEGELSWSFEPSAAPALTWVEPIKPVESKKQAIERPKARPKTQTAQLEAAGQKSLTVKYFEIQSATGYNQEELDQIRTDLEAQKAQVLRERMEKRLEQLTSENRLAPIILPLVFQRVEEAASRRSVLRNAHVRSHFKELDEVFKAVLAEKGSGFLNQKIVGINLRDKASRLSLGKEIVTAINPDFEQEVERAVRTSMSDRNPAYMWRARAAEPAVSGRLPTAGKKRSRLSVSSGIKSQASRIMADLQSAQTSEARIEQLNKLNGLLESLGVAAAPAPEFEVQQKPDTSSFRPTIHKTVNYFDYKIELDRFECIRKNERSHDEAYFIFQTILPRFNPQEIQGASEIGAGRLYNINTKNTRSYGGIDPNQTYSLVQGERLLFWQNLYNTQAVFSIDLYEEDYTKAEVVAGYRDAAAQLTQSIVNDIKNAVLEYVGETVLASLAQVLPPELTGLVGLLLDGAWDESTFMKIQESLGGIKADLIILSMLLSGKSFTEVLNFLSAGNPELYLIIMAIDVCGPILMDFFEGDWEEGIKSLLLLPFSLIKSLVDIFTDICGFFTNLMKALDPDDHIMTRRVTIKAATENLAADANWDQRDLPGGGGGDRYPGDRTHLKSMPLFVQPELWFAGADAFYKLYYNVTRTLTGGKDIYSFSLNPENGAYSTSRVYKVKAQAAGEPIKVKIALLEPGDVPFVWMSGLGGQNGNFGQYEFEVPGFHDKEYTITICAVSSRPVLGFISVEENNDIIPYKNDTGY